MKYHGTRKSSIENQALTSESLRYQYTEKDRQANNRTEFIVNKIDKTITGVVEEQSEQKETMSKLEMKTDELSLEVASKLDLTKTVTSTNGYILLENCLEGPIVKFRIKGNNIVFGDKLYTGDNSFIGTSTYGEESKETLLDKRTLGNYIRLRHRVKKIPSEISNYYIDDNGVLQEDNINQAYGSIVIENTSEIVSILTVKKKYGQRFRVATYGSLDIGTNSLQEFVYDTREEIENISILPNSIGKYIVINFYDGNNDTCTKEEMYNSLQIYDKSIKFDLTEHEVLRQFEDVYDEIVFENQILKIIRRIGVYEDGSMYKLALEETTTVYDDTTVTSEDGVVTGGVYNVLDGDNELEILSYHAPMEVVYVPENESTLHYSTTYQVQSMIKMLENSLTLMVKGKLDESEIIAAINLAVEQEQGIINITSNQLTIDSDNFKLTKEGKVTAVSGSIGNLSLSSNKLYNTYNNGKNESGIYIPTNIPTAGNQVFLYAGHDTSKSNYADSKMFIHHNGNMYFRSGSLNMIYEPTVNSDGSYSWINALSFTADAITNYLKNGNRWASYGIGYENGGEKSQGLWLYDALQFQINDGVHGQGIINIERANNDNGNKTKTTIYSHNTSIVSKGSVYIDANTEQLTLTATNNNVWIKGGNYTFIQGSVYTPTSSDIRLKENIKESDSALEKIQKIKIYSFDWNNEEQVKWHGGKHENFGYIAQEVKDIDESLILHEEEQDTWQMKTLSLAAMNTKAIQELSNKIDKQEEIINKQQEMINTLLDEINKLKGENNG